jgi:hypothetical protein
MSTPSPADPLLDQTSRVVESLVTVAKVPPDAIMVVGAWCRDIWHHRLGHSFATSVTRDIDLALALSSWDAFRLITSAFTPVGDSGIRFRIADYDVDVLPFGVAHHRLQLLPDQGRPRRRPPAGVHRLEQHRRGPRATARDGGPVRRATRPDPGITGEREAWVRSDRRRGAI